MLPGFWVLASPFKSGFQVLFISNKELNETNKNGGKAYLKN